MSVDNLSTNNMNTINNDINKNIYRYKFTDDFTSELFKFSKVHQYDHRKDFKEAWEIWMEDNDDIVNNEVRRLTNIGYDGDIIDKMFKSARLKLMTKIINLLMVLMSFVRVTWIYLRRKYQIYVNMDLQIQMKLNKKSKKHIKIDIS